jgi:hypothetical protein
MRALQGVVLLMMGCSGLYVEPGNSYPCDFSLGPGLRDGACVSGDVCGSNNVCQKYIYEGPRFEGPATVPVYGSKSDAGAVLHPLVLNSAFDALSADLPLSVSRNLYVRFPDGGILSVSPAGRISGNAIALPPLPGNVSVAGVQPFLDGRNFIAITTRERSLFIVGDLRPLALVQDGLNPWKGEVRFIDDAPRGPNRFTNRTVVVGWTPNSLGVLDPVDGTFQPALALDGGVLDVAGLTQPNRVWLALLKNESLAVVDADGGTTSNSIPLTPGNAVSAGTLRTDRDGRIIAAIRRTNEIDVLSTFQLSFGATGPVVTQPWPDCRPCQRPGQQVVLYTPSVATGLPVVEVVCSGATGTQSVRVVGSVALTQDNACLAQSFESPVPFSRALSIDRKLVAWNNQSSVLLAGRSGELWTGSLVSGLKPIFLERVPRDVAPIAAEQDPSLAVLTDDSLFVLQTPGALVSFDGGVERMNGFRRLSTQELGVPDDAKLLAFVHGVEGWAISGRGEVTRARTGINAVSLNSSTRLVTASQEPIRSTIGGEAFVGADGGVLGLFVAADDSVYFVESPEAALAAATSETLLTPNLTPEPSVPIRSLALERTPLGTDGVSRARGYLVTSRNVYSWKLGGVPARWSTSLLALGGGEPQEVWFDSPRSALGRVGFSDGEVDSLPGGYVLVEPLPSGSGGVPQVLDYENLGGWPVAYATTGLFVAGWDVVDAKLQNRFPDGGINRPMNWREMRLPDGGAPWLSPRGAVPGRLFVQVDARIPAGQPNEGLRLHRLLLFLDTEVIEVARHFRK